MIKKLKHIWYGLPMQLLLLHTKRFQIFLVFWYVLFAVVTGNFMKDYGADALFLAPEYYNQVSAISVAIVGFALGIFIMSWNITTFILNGHFVSFLATTAQPFLKYCINNAVLPLSFILFYLTKSIVFEKYQELLNLSEIILLVMGFIAGLVLSISISFIYFFGADKTIYFILQQKIIQANEAHDKHDTDEYIFEKNYIKVAWFYSAKLKYRLPRDMKHYDNAFVKKVLSRHNFAAVIAILFSFIFLVFIGFVNDNKFFQIPAAASVLLFFALLISVSGAFSIFFRKWSLLVLVCIYLIINYLYQKDIIDPKNKAYGLNYNKQITCPNYDEKTLLTLANEKDITIDKNLYLKILNNWKAKQKDSLPTMYIINTSGGGLRSASFTMNILQQLNKEMNGKLMDKTLFISGASGGMLGASYFRELYLQKENVNDKKWVSNISSDLLNPIFSSGISRDIIGPVLKFKINDKEYAKDRGYAFEQTLHENTHNILNKKISDYKKMEQDATIPFMMFNSVITRDARKMIIASNSLRFMMKPSLSKNIDAVKVDAVDFTSYFKNQEADDLKISSALRMNATFPYVLPNVWLPTNPVIDVMDAGLRDNYGLEITLRFLEVFKDWIQKNTSKVVILEIRDRDLNDWKTPTNNEDYLSFLLRPLATIHDNMFKLQDYAHAAQMNYFSNNYENKFESICWQYIPENNKHGAGLSFHLTTTEKKSIAEAVFSNLNEIAFEKLRKTLHQH